MRHKQKTLMFAVLVAAIGLGDLAQAGEKIQRPQDEKPKQLLFVGNSYLYYGDSLHNHVRRMALENDPEHKKAYKYKSATISGAYLAHHNIDSYLTPGQLGIKTAFDYVIIQGHSTASLSDKKRNNFRKYALEFAQKIKNSGAKPVLYMTTAYVSPHKKASSDMMGQIQSLYDSVGAEAGALVVPVGLAFERAYKARPDLRLHKDYDGSHPDLIGTYLAAATVYATIYGVSPVGNSYDYFGKINSETRLFLQTIAEQTVQDYFSK